MTPDPRPHTCFDYERVGKGACVFAFSLGGTIASALMGNMALLAVAASVMIASAVITGMYLDGNPYSRKRARQDPPSPATEEQRHERGAREAFGG